MRTDFKKILPLYEYRVTYERVGIPTVKIWESHIYKTKSEVLKEWEERGIKVLSFESSIIRKDTFICDIEHFKKISTQVEYKEV